MGEWRSDLKNAPQRGRVFLSYWPAAEGTSFGSVALVHYDSDGFLRDQSGVMRRGEPEYWAEIEPVPRKIRCEIGLEAAQAISSMLSGRNRSLYEQQLLEALTKGLRGVEVPE